MIIIKNLMLKNKLEYLKNKKKKDNKEDGTHAFSC